MALLDRVRSLFGGPAPDDTTDQDFIRACADMGSDRTGRYDLSERYYDGKVGPQLTERAKLFLEESGCPFTENFVETVVDSMARRLEVESFQAADSDDVSDWLNQTMWPASSFPQLQNIVHVETPKLGDYFLIAGFDNDRGLPVFHYNHPSQVKPVYVATEAGWQMAYCPKRWETTERGAQNPSGKSIWRLNIYFPDRIEKWFSADKEGEVWARWMEDEDEEGNLVWPTPWTDDADEPLGIPVFHFRNKAQGRTWGRSEVRGAIPFQRELNKEIVDLFYVMDLQGWSQRWGTGIKDGDKATVAVGEILTAADPNARFGQFDPADPTKLTDTALATLKRMSAKTATPLHELISGTPVSGESQKTAADASVDKAEDFQTDNGGVWSDASAYGWKLAEVFGSEGVPGFDPDVRIETHWKDAAPRNEETEAMVLEAHGRMGVSKRTRLQKLGYDPDDEAKWRKEEAQEAGEAEEEFLKRFNRGGNGTED